MKLYEELAQWWPLISAPADYAEEAALYLQVLADEASGRVRSVLELGSGGGNNASHLKAHVAMTLVDQSKAMIEVSRALNPECEHLVGDMRTVRVGRQFDAVFVHDAVGYLTTVDDLAAAAETVWMHCRPGGSALFVPDHTRENFAPETSHGGHDGKRRAARYLSWAYDPDPADTSYITDYAFMLRDGSETVVEFDRHVQGLFPIATWMDVLQDVGFTVEYDSVALSDGDTVTLFVCARPKDS